MPELTLYHFPSCPYCKVVMDCLERLNLEIPMRDTHADEGAKQELIEMGGKSQVPCLIIDGKPLYESADIVSWLEKNSG